LWRGGGAGRHPDHAASRDRRRLALARNPCAPAHPRPRRRPGADGLTRMFAIENLQKSFIASGAEVRAVDGISLGVETGKLITLLGPSGCGKTTTLRCLAGLERPQSG